MADEPISALTQKGILKPTDACLVTDNDATATSKRWLPSAAIWFFGDTAAETAALITPTDYRYEPGNVLRYGVNSVPGTTDMTTAIQAVIDQYASGGAVGYFPRETFACGALTVADSLHMMGEGIIDGSAATSRFKITANMGHLILDGLTFQNFDYEDLSEGCGIFVADTTSIVVSKVQVTDCTFQNSTGGLFLKCIVENSIVTENRFLNLNVTTANMDTAGIWFGNNVFANQDQMEKHIITGNFFETITGNDEVHGILINGREFAITDNILSGITNTILTDSEAIYTKARYGEISENTLTDCDAGDNRGAIAVKGSLRAGSSSPQGFAVRVHNNILISTTGATNGIYIQNEDVDCSDNYLEGFGLYAITTASLANANINICNNTIRKHRGTTGILTQAYGKNIIVEDNFVDEVLASQGTIATASGIQVSLSSAGTDTVRVNNNTVVDNAASSATTNLRGIRIQTGASGDIDTLEVSNNTVNITRNATTSIFGVSIELRAAVSSFAMAGNNCAGIGIATNNFPIHGDTTTATHLPATNLDIRDNIGWGPVYDLNPSNIEWYHSGVTFANIGASGTRTTALPIAIPGLSFSFTATDNHELRVDPDGTELIRGGTAGQYLALDTQGDSVSLVCFVAGQWEIVAGFGTYTYA